MITYVKVTYSNDSLWGDTDPYDEGYDTEASEAMYEKLIIDEVHKHYSAATVRVERDLTCTVEVHAEDANEHLDAKAIVTDIIDDVYGEAQWHVYTPDDIPGFSPKECVDDLHYSLVDATAMHYDFYGARGWEYYEAVRCYECGKITVVYGSASCPRCDNHLYAEGPMMNYAWPVDVDRIGGYEDAAKALVDLPLCVVEIDENVYLALTGGGMDLSWEIAEGYIRLGFIPPAAIAKLPNMCKRMTDRNVWILDACALAAEHLKIRAGWIETDLARTRAAMVDRSKED